MKKIAIILIALVLCIIMAALAPAQVMAAANGNGTQYVSEVKVGMGTTSEEAAAELLAEGYTILLDADGAYSDLNYKSGSESIMKTGPRHRVVYLGYKTTDNPKDAITDLAVMNMNGGYSTQDYDILMSEHMEGEIKPFVNRFIAAMKEYRENYNKPADSLGHKRADYYRQMLNKLTDDDTGDQPLGDLLLNETKYEMGDDKYNALSDAEKNKRADILTLLMQGNGRAILLLETLISKATDSADDTWIDRFLNTSTEELQAKIKEDNPNLTTEADIVAEMDKTYNDIAKKIYEKWDAFRETIIAYDDNVNEIDNAELPSSEELAGKTENLEKEKSADKIVDTVVDTVKTNTELSTTMVKGEEAVVIDYLDETETEDGTLLEFFDRDKSELEGENIRQLYPIAAALSEGQIAGLDFLSITDLFSLALINEDGFDTLKLDEIDPASVYQDVDRAIYEPGGVALTNKALRDQANALDDDSDFMLSPLGIAFWGMTGLMSIGTIVSVAVNQSYVSKLATAWTAFETSQEEVKFCANFLMNPWIDQVEEAAVQAQNSIKSNLQIVNDSALDIVNYTAKAPITKYIALGFAVVTAVLAAYSMYVTISEALAYYKVDFAPIPKYMVEETDITEVVNGKTIMKKNETAYYKVAQCNRKEGDSDIEKENYRILGTSNDLNGDVGKQWLALYYVKYNEGRPILADSFKVIKGKTDLPNGYETGIHRFGESAAFNLTHTYYVYNDKPNGTYVYYKNADQTMNQLLGIDTSTSGSLFSGGSLALGAGLGLILGGGIVALIMSATRKRKEEQAV